MKTRTRTHQQEKVSSVKRIAGTTADRDTGWTPGERATAEEIGHGPAWRPILAGMLEILASAPYFVASVMFYLFPTKVQVGFITYGSGETTPVIIQVWAPAGLVVWLPFAVPLVVGGICSLFRKGWDLALLGPIVPLALTAISLAWGHLGLTAFGSLFVFGWVPAMAVRWAIVAAFFAIMLAAVILVALSRKQFPRRRKPTPYHGAGPG